MNDNPNRPTAYIALVQESFKAKSGEEVQIPIIVTTSNEMGSYKIGIRIIDVKKRDKGEVNSEDVFYEPIDITP